MPDHGLALEGGLLFNPSEGNGKEKEGMSSFGLVEQKHRGHYFVKILDAVLLPSCFSFCIQIHGVDLTEPLSKYHFPPLCNRNPYMIRIYKLPLSRRLV